MPQYRDRYQGIGHYNQLSYGPCHYFRLRNGRRVLFRANELEGVTRAPFMGGLVKVKGGLEYEVDSPTPEVIMRVR